jgi:hypothetical protein
MARSADIGKIKTETFFYAPIPVHRRRKAAPIGGGGRGVLEEQAGAGVQNSLKNTDK